jgi:murein peptide amidase A
VPGFAEPVAVPEQHRPEGPPPAAAAPSSSSCFPQERRGLNLNGYAGETIDIEAVLAEISRTAADCGWRTERIGVAKALDLLAFRRASDRSSRRVYLSAGIHGDEPAAPLAVRQLLRENQWPTGAEYWVLPCLNPTGFGLNRRENADGHDLNRDYRHPRTPEVRAHVAYLERQPAFDLTLLLHEDWEAHGFYVYELNRAGQPSLAETMVAAVSAVCPIDRSPLIEGRPAQDGIIRPQLDPNSRPDWPEAFYLSQHKAPLSYTLEAPSDFPLTVRVAALVSAVQAALRQFAGGPACR